MPLRWTICPNRLPARPVPTRICAIMRGMPWCSLCFMVLAASPVDACSLLRIAARPWFARMCPMTIPDCLRVKYLRAYARRTRARMNARSSCARMTHHDPMEVAWSASAIFCPSEIYADYNDILLSATLLPAITCHYGERFAQTDCLRVRYRRAYARLCAACHGVACASWFLLHRL